MFRKKDELLIALAGNPNAGKTTIFNGMTGANQHVGNYPGVTVDKKEGHIHYDLDGEKIRVTVVDLPGTYSLSSYSEEERVARGFLLNENPDTTIVVMDSSHLQRHLAFALQLMELGRPVVLDLNMIDEATEKGYIIDEEKLSKIMGVPICSTIGRTGEGLKRLLRVAVEEGRDRHFSSYQIDYGPEVERAIQKILSFDHHQGEAPYRHPSEQENGTIKEHSQRRKFTRLNHPQRWYAVKLLEGDREVQEWVKKNWQNGEKIVEFSDQMRNELSEALEEEVEIYIVSRRAVAAAGIVREVTKYEEKPAGFSSKLDQVLTDRIWGIPIFLFIMWLTFNIVFTLGEYPQGWIEDGVAIFSDWVGEVIPPGDLHSLLVDGIIGGVGSVLSFLPNIILLFLITAFMEDTGYLARAAFIVDRGMRAIGLQGKAFIPYFIGFGCTVPAVMGTRILESPRDRMTTMLTLTFMSCNARIPIYTLLIGAFFATEWAGTVLFGIYLFGIVIGILMALIFRKTLFRGDDEPFVMELPPYRLPTLWGVVMHMWERCILYIKKAGTIILAASILIWFITSYPQEGPWFEETDREIAQVEETFHAEVLEQVLLPLEVKTLEENEELFASVGAVLEAREAAEVEAEESESEPTEVDIELLLGSSKMKEATIQYFELKDAFDEQISDLEHTRASLGIENSYAGRMGKTIEPLIRPLGFDWKIGVGLVGAFAAKEVLVSTLGIIYSVDNADEEPAPLQEILAADPTFSPLVAICLMIFSLLYCPCLAVIGVFKRETRSYKWAAFYMVYPTILAWVVTFMIYQGGRMLGF